MWSSFQSPVWSTRPAGVSITIATQSGIEWAIRAMATLQDLRPPPTYVVAGRTHPRLCEADGTGYRRELVRLADDAELRRRMGAKAACDVAEILSPARYARTVEALLRGSERP